ncbi:MAG: 3-deoxy-manno-octulosonate cytidylyltransferase [Thalassospira sp.]|nr:3-deoxy-manno-octulosonate cytidylyltransferase [Thalassospira sp.]
MNTVVMIPARYGSSRMPGKPLVAVAGVPLLRRVWRLAVAAAGDGTQVYVATDDGRIASLVESFGGQVIMTPPECLTGTDRCLAAAVLLPTRPDAVVNVQGDAVLTPPWVIRAVIDGLRAHPDAALITPAVALIGSMKREFLEHKAKSPSSGTTVVCDSKGRALYFSKALLPFERTPSNDQPMLRHIGLYGYRMAALEQLCALPESPLEKAEQLEQLRALENGLTIQVIPVDYQGRSHGSIDASADVAAVEAIIQREGELVVG